MFFYIVRHGQTEWNNCRRTQGSKDIELNNIGREQARKISLRLHNIPFREIYSSNLKRAYETAKIIGTNMNKTPKIDADLREVSFGSWEGLTIDEIHQCYPGHLEMWENNYDFFPDNGESLYEVQNRTKKFIEKIDNVNYDDNDNILIISHGITISILIIELLKLPISFLRSIKYDNSSLNIIEYSNGKGRVHLLNDTCHIND